MFCFKSTVFFLFLINLLLVFQINAKPNELRINTTKTVSTHMVDVQVTKKTSTVENDHKIFFPESGEVNVVSRILGDNLETKCPNNICEDVENYPSSLVLDVVKKDKKLQKYFKESVSIAIANRNMIGEEEKSVCDSIQRPEFPKAAINLNKTKRLIVNEGQYQQGFISEICSKKATCFLGDSSFIPNDYEYGCKQRYAIRRLVTITEDNQTDFDSFEFPSCCVCTYRKK